jgi:ethanolamine permease
MSQPSIGAPCAEAGAGFFEKRGLSRYAGIWSLWALGVGAVISGHFSGWNYGLGVAGWGGLLVAAAIMAVMYLCLVFCIAEMSAAMPSAGASYSFARAALGPWGGFLSGLCENVEYVLTPAVICFFIGSYLGSMFDTGLPDWCWWFAAYGLFLFFNIRGVALSFRVTVIMTLVSLAILILFCALALPHIDIGRYALNIASDGGELAAGHGSPFPFGVAGIVAALPFAVWLYLAIEELPLAAEESIDPRRDMPRGILLALATLIVTAFLIAAINPAIPGVGAYSLATSGEPVLDGFRALYGGTSAVALSLIALTGLIASFHAILFGLGRQIFALSRAGYFPAGFSRTHAVHKTPHIALCSGAALGLAIMMGLWFGLGGKAASPVIGSLLLNMAVFGALLSYIFRAVSFLLLRSRHPGLERPFVSPLGSPAAYVTIAISIVTLGVQMRDPNFAVGILCVALWFAIASIYFALAGRHRLILSPEEQFALTLEEPPTPSAETAQAHHSALPQLQ